MYPSKRSPLMIFISLVLVILTACSPAAPTAAPAGPQATAAPTEAPATAAPTEAPTEAATAAPASAANTLTFDSNLNDMISLDPAVTYEFGGILTVHNVYQTLVQFVGSDLTTIKPSLADSWDTKDAGDHWEMTFKLHPGNKFASGNPITADDVVYSFSRVIPINGPPSFLFSAVGGLTTDSVKAVDPETVVISLPKTASPAAFLSVLTNTIAGIVDSEVVKTHETSGDFGSGWLLDHSAGSGPYVVDHWTKDVEVLLKANPNYGGTKPALDSILVKNVPESSVQLTELQQGDADIAQNLTPEQLATLSGDSVALKGDNLQLFYVGMNVAVKPLDKVEVREALRMAVDYDGIINDLLSGNGKKVQTIIPAGFFGFNEDAPFQQDVEGAKALLQKAGVSDASLEMLVPEGAGPGGIAFADLAAKLQSDWDQIGVDIKQVSFAELLAAYREQKAQLALLYWGPDFADPDTNVAPFTEYQLKSIAWRNSWDDKDIATKAQAAALMTDQAEREAAYKEITEYVLHNGPYVILYQSSALFGIRSNVQGFAWSPIGYADLWSVSKTS
jgi:peptide/nickel transport system substrate-binding protein